jgi:DNA polymerase elongation subunit (family B)
MEFKLTKINPNNCTLEELEKEIQRLNSLKEEYHGLEQSIKIWMNSVYGATASPYFIGFNVNIAEATTLQGQEIIKFASKIIDDYFMNYWHLDKSLHSELGITYVNKLNEKTLTIYGDTDSTFITFDPVLKSCDYSGDPVEFILLIKKLRLNSFLKNNFEKYANKYNTTNIQDLELEKISYSAITVTKKKYILDLAWKEPNVYFRPQEKIKFTGVEIVKGDTPKFARKVLKDLMKIVCEKRKSLLYADIVKKLKEIKKEYVLQNPEDIAKTQALGDYEKYCLEDKKQIRLVEKCPQNVRSSAVYNHIVLNSSKYRTKYNIIKTGDKVKFYYTNDENEVFGFLPGCYPYEFAPSINYDLQFEKTIVSPFNRILESIGYASIPGSLIYAKSLF